MIIELRNEETGNVKKISHGINWFLLITAPIFGITLFKKPFWFYNAYNKCLICFRDNMFFCI